jgi:hypothetical protein
MAWFARKAPRTSPAPTEAALVQETLTEFAPQVTALTQHLPRALGQQTVTPLLHRLVALCWDLPASEAHHHRRPFGLLVHSLEVATQALETFTQSSLWWAKAPDPAARHRTADRWRLGTALAGLLHDLGKIFDVRVELPPAGDGFPACWDPFQEPLLVLLLRHQTGAALPTPTVHWQPGRGMQHDTAGTLAATLLLTRADLQALTLPVARELFLFLGGAPAPGNLFRQLIRQPPVSAPYAAADGQSVRTDLQAMPPAQPTLAARVLDTLAQCCREGPLRVNQFPGHVFVLAEETLVVVPEALKPVRQRLAREGVSVSGGGILYNDLAAAGYLLGPAGRNVTTAVFQPAGRRPVPLAVLRLPHAPLWGAHPPAPFPGQVTLDRPEAAEADSDPPLAPAPAPAKE